MPVRTLRVPDLGVSAESLRLCNWLVAVGAEVAAGQRVAELLADEALVELTSPWSGRLLTVCVPAEAAIAVGDALARIETDDRSGK